MKNSSTHIEELTRKFLEFEATEIKDNDWATWQSIRHDLYYQIQNQLVGVPSVSSARLSHTHNRASVLIECIKFFWRSLTSKNKIIFFAASRYQHSSKKHFDPNILDIYSLVKKDAFIIDSILSTEGCIYPSCLNIASIIHRIYRCIFKNRAHTLPKYIPSKIKERFGIDINVGSLETEIYRFEFEKKWYTHYFKFMRPKAIFLTQNGIQTGLIISANNLNIPIVEFQHGIIYYGHPAYSFPNKVRKETLIIPDYFITFSKFWKNKVNDCFPVNEIIDMGNTFSSTIISNTPKYDLTFISSTPHNPKFIEVISELKANGYSGKICLKLHPHQILEIDGIKDTLSQFSDVDVVYNESTMKEIIGMSKVLLAIESTSVYEALDAGKRVLILTEMSYEGLSDVFDNPLVTLVGSSLEIMESLNSNEGDEIKSNQIPSRYFEPFNAAKAKEFLRAKLQLDV